MSLVYIGPEHAVQPGDIVIRQKHSGLGWHYGTGVSGGLVKETTPETGKRLATLEQFCAGKQGLILRPDRSHEEKAMVEQRALVDLGFQYDGAISNCEHDSSFAQTGVASSPTVKGILLLAGAALAVGIAHTMSDN